MLKVFEMSVTGLTALMLGMVMVPMWSGSEPTHAATQDDPTISITPTDGIKLNMTPTAGAAGSFGTVTASVAVNTTNITGYTLSMNTETTDTDLKNAKVDYTAHPDQKITNITASTAQTNFAANKWGYNVNKNGTYIKGADGTYIPVPNSGSSTEDKQIEATSAAGSNTYTFTYGVKANNDLPAGSYNNTIVFSATANALPKYSLTVNFAGSGVSSVKICLVSGNCSGSDLVGTVSSSGGSVANLTYSDNYYLYPIFASGNEFDSWAKTSGEGSISATDTANPYYTIGNGNATVTVTGKSSKLWFQNATSANCGQTMYDNRGTDAYKNVAYSTATIGSLCWMTRNLDLPGGTKLSHADTNVPEGYSTTTAGFTNGDTLPASSTSGFSSSTTAYVYNSNSTTCGNNSPCYSYYSWRAATAGYNSTSSSTPVNYDICPSGWRLPTQAELTTLKNSYSTGAALTGSPFLGVYAGIYYNSQFYDGGSYGYYWSSTAGNSYYAYRLYFDSSDAGVGVNYKVGGYSVRCVAQS